MMDNPTSHAAENESRLGIAGNTSEVELESGRLTSRGSLTGITVAIDLRYCKGCGICAAECPTHALEMVPEEGRIREALEACLAEELARERPFSRERLLAWQELPHQAGLIVYDGEDSDNRTGAWRIGEVVMADADKCVLCGLCYHYCPEDIIRVRRHEPLAPADADEGDGDVPGRS